MSIFSYKGWNLLEAMNGLMAYDMGAIDSGIHDEDLKQEVKSYLRGLSSLDRQTVLVDYLRHYRLNQPDFLDDRVEFDLWLKEFLQS